MREKNAGAAIAGQDSEPPVRLIFFEESESAAGPIYRELESSQFFGEIRLAQDEARLRAALKSFGPDAVLSAHSASGCSAAQALALARAAHPGIPFICVSEPVGEESVAELLKAGADEFVLKSNLSRLVPCLRRALNAARERAELRIDEQELRAELDRLHKSQRMEAVGRLAGGIAHDFNNILTTISGYCELLMMQLPPEAAQREEVSEIVSASGRAAKLTRQLLAFARRQVLEVRTLDLNDFLRGAEFMICRVIGPSARVELSLESDLRRVRADASQLELVLMNLALNARDAMTNGGALRISTKSDGDFVELQVADSGVGMDADVRSHLFEPFFTTKEKGKGTGLGLSTVYGIVRQCGGTIEVESQPGRGASFRIQLPATDESANQTRPSAPIPTAPAARETILVIEDEAPLRRLVRRILGGHGYQVLVAATAEEAASALENEAPVDIALVDVLMPGVNGPALVDQLRRRRPALKALFMSGYADQSLLPATENGRSFPFLPKPFAASALIAKVRETLDSPAT